MTALFQPQIPKAQTLEPSFSSESSTYSACPEPVEGRTPRTLRWINPLEKEKGMLLESGIPFQSLRRPGRLMTTSNTQLEVSVY